MPSVHQVGDELVIETDSRALGRFLWLLAAALGGWAVVGAMIDRRFVHEEPFIEIVAGAVVLALVALLFTEESRFVFDRRRRVLAWRRRWALSRRSGRSPSRRSSPWWCSGRSATTAWPAALSERKIRGTHCPLQQGILVLLIAVAIGDAP